jgi:prepilin-type N-terminal cleavage/methylation domain-containing protein
MMESSPRRLPARAFTLVELLTVVAVLGVLAAFLLPSVGAARAAVQIGRTRLQFAGWMTAFEAHRQEYGRYPTLPGGAGAALINAGAGATSAESHWFHDVLAGRHRDGSSLPDSFAGNPWRRRLLRFGGDEFVGTREVAEGLNRENELGLLRDAFGNTSIMVLIDANEDGVIDHADFGELPALLTHDGRVGPVPAELTSGHGIRAGVAFYSARPNAVSDDALITSWR